MPPQKTRTTHVFRAANKDDEDVWLDVERVDKFITRERRGRPYYQKMTRNLFWGENEYADPYEHPTRTTQEVKIKNPEDEEIFVPLHVIDKMVTRRGQQNTYLKRSKIYVNDREKNQTRIYSVRRVFHWDTATDPRDDGGTEYARVEGTEDRDQYVDVALIEKIVTRTNQGPKYRKRTFVFNTEPIKEFSEPTPEGEIDLENIIFLDPWQNIVNVQWSTIEFVTISLSVELIWEPTEEFVFFSSSATCPVSMGYTTAEYNTRSHIHFIVDTGAIGEPDSIHGVYQNGQLTSAGGGEITGLTFPFPKTVDLAPWQFVGMFPGFPNVPVLRLQFEEADGEIILDRNGNPVEAFTGFPFRRADSVEFTGRGQAYTAGPECWTTADFPILPREIGFVENLVGVTLVTEIPEVAETISISSIMVEYQGKTFQGCGYHSDGGINLQIICEKVTTP